MATQFAQFKHRRRIALWLGIVIPALLILAAIIGISTLSNYYMTAFIIVALLLGWVSTRQYRCPFCSGDPEEDQDVPTFYPQACAHCGERLRSPSAIRVISPKEQGF